MQLGLMCQCMFAGGVWYSMCREVKPVPVILPHEAINKHWSSLSEDFLLETFDPSHWAPNFHEHPVVKGAAAGQEHLVAPYCIYSDAAPFTKPDSFWSIMVCDMRFSVHHMCCILLKRDFCQCGCHGYCTVYPVQKLFVKACANSSRLDLMDGARFS